MSNFPSTGKDNYVPFILYRDTEAAWYVNSRGNTISPSGLGDRVVISKKTFLFLSFRTTFYMSFQSFGISMIVLKATDWTTDPKIMATCLMLKDNLYWPLYYVIRASTCRLNLRLMSVAITWSLSHNRTDLAEPYVTVRSLFTSVVARHIGIPKQPRTTKTCSVVNE